MAALVDWTGFVGLKAAMVIVVARAWKKAAEVRLATISPTSAVSTCMARLLGSMMRDLLQSAMF